MTSVHRALVARLAEYDRLLEIGVGRRPEVAAALATAGADVRAVDVRPFPVPDGVRFVRDDIVERSERLSHDPEAVGPDDLYRVDAAYALNLPPELHRPARSVARAVGADLLFTTLGHDEPAVPVRREPLPDVRETLFVVLASERSDCGPRK